MSTPSPVDFSSQAHRHLFGHLVPFWTGPALDHEHGGWVAWMNNNGSIDHAKPQGLVVNCRLLWTFSAIYRLAPAPLYKEMAQRALRMLTERFWDNTHGGAFWQLDNEGRVLDDSKKCYGQAFYIYALVEHYRAFNCRESLERAISLFDLLECHTHDDQDGGYWEVRRRDWSEASDTRLSDKDMDEKKSMNNHLHMLEAYASLLSACPKPTLEKRLRELIDLFQTRILASNGCHFHHFFDARWNVRSETCTYGHDIEGSWLLCEAAEALGDSALKRSMETLALRIADATLREGINENGALSYEGRNGTIIDPAFECWPQAEAVVGFINAWQLSGEQRFFNAAWRVWRFIEDHLADRQGGEWFWRILPDGSVDPNLPKVSEWKGPYHGSRACLEIVHRLTRAACPQNR